MHRGEGSRPKAESIRRQLARILNSPNFASAQRSRTFLGYVVEKVIAGTTTKEYEIAVEVMGRGTGYDPAVDATVRVEAGRLRTRLRDYYDGPGKNDPILIEIPKGGYSPVFHVRQPVVESEQILAESATPPGDDPVKPSVIDAEPKSALQSISAAGKKKPLAGWALVGGILTSFLAAAAIWYARRPLPPPQFTGYNQITHDGLEKTLVGTDGSRLYFNRMAGPTTPGSIAEVAIAGGGIAQIPVALPDPLLMDLSPNGSSFLIAAQTGLWNVPILGGQARHLGNAYQASFSPDGNSVAFSAADGGLHVVGSDGTGAHQVARVATPSDAGRMTPAPAR